MSVPTWSAAELIEGYDALAIDAYGVLVDGQGAIGHAAAFIDALRSRNKPFLLVTNDASRTPSSIAARFAGLGIAIDVDQVLSSGSLMAPWLVAHGHADSPVAVLGPADAQQMVTSTGARLTEPSDPDVRCIVVADDSGFDFLPTIEAALSTISRRLDAGQSIDLLLPNPDIIYPRPEGKLAFTAGAVAELLERGLAARFGPTAPSFTRLGKPHLPIFAQAKQRLGTSGRTVMLGDQLDTDVAGALAAGFDAALVLTGVGRVRPGESLQPTMQVADLAL